MLGMFFPLFERMGLMRRIFPPSLPDDELHDIWQEEDRDSDNEDRIWYFDGRIIDSDDVGCVKCFEEPPHQPMGKEVGWYGKQVCKEPSSDIQIKLIARRKISLTGGEYLVEYRYLELSIRDDPNCGRSQDRDYLSEIVFLHD